MADSNGAVTVYGRVPTSEEDRLLSTIHAVPGVREIINRVESCPVEAFGASYRSSAAGSLDTTGSSLNSGTTGYTTPSM